MLAANLACYAQVVDVNGKKVLVAEADGQVSSLASHTSHLGRQLCSAQFETEPSMAGLPRLRRSVCSYKRQAERPISKLRCTSAQVYTVSNKCTHLNVSLVGKTPLLQGRVRRARLMRPRALCRHAQANVHV